MALASLFHPFIEVLGLGRRNFLNSLLVEVSFYLYEDLSFSIPLRYKKFLIFSYRRSYKEASEVAYYFYYYEVFDILESFIIRAPDF